MFKVHPAISLDRCLLSIYYGPGPGETVVTKGHRLCSLGGTDYRKQEALFGGFCVFVPRLVASRCPWSCPESLGNRGRIQGLPTAHLSPREPLPAGPCTPPVSEPLGLSPGQLPSPPPPFHPVFLPPSPTFWHRPQLSTLAGRRQPRKNLHEAYPPSQDSQILQVWTRVLASGYFKAL